ncbi:hypothetical protein F4054_16485 [Candidatus Poribacteria bacterium]|nr:hypothetical protein [Candidatus Poribacteria bacterium]MYK23839.1 hypothetical protein [Candidatus Poribacteria bacterium]
MSETQRTLFNRSACYLCIAGALLLLAVVVVVRVLLPSPREPVAVDTLPAPRREVSPPTPAVFDAEAFKRTIIDNNLFRPLGWRPPRPIEPYRLLGTILPRSETHSTPQAIIESTTGEKTYIVSTGETLDALTSLVSIESKQVILSTNGHRRTLKLPSGF